MDTPPAVVTGALFVGETSKGKPPVKGHIPYTRVHIVYIPHARVDSECMYVTKVKIMKLHEHGRYGMLYYVSVLCMACATCNSCMYVLAILREELKVCEHAHTHTHTINFNMQTNAV